METYEVRFGRYVAADIQAILSHIGEARGAAFARSYVDRIVSYCEGFRTFPHRGTLRNDVRDGLRFVGWRRTATIAFRIDDDARVVFIAAVLYKGRDVLETLRDRDIDA